MECKERTFISSVVKPLNPILPKLYLLYMFFNTKLTLKAGVCASFMTLQVCPTTSNTQSDRGLIRSFTFILDRESVVNGLSECIRSSGPARVKNKPAANTQSFTHTRARAQCLLFSGGKKVYSTARDTTNAANPYLKPRRNTSLREMGMLKVPLYLHASFRAQGSLSPLPASFFCTTSSGVPSHFHCL